MRWIWLVGLLLLGLSCWMATPAPCHAEPLVSLDTQGKPLPGAVTQWKQERFDRVSLVLKEAKAKEVAAILSRKLPQGEAYAVTAQRVRITGIPVGELYHLLAAIDLNEAETPEAFLRSFPAVQGAPKGHEEAIRGLIASGVLPFRSRWTATVVSVERAAFPLCQVHVKLNQLPKEALPVAGLREGNEVTVVPNFSLKDKADPLLANLAEPISMLNTGAYFLRPGDTITFQIGGVYKGKLLAAQLVRTDSTRQVLPSTAPKPKNKPVKKPK